MQNQTPVIVMNTAPERQSGRKAQISNIQAAKTVSDVIRTCLGPRAMLKMILDPMGGIVLTNDGHTILREIEVAHPAAKSMIELSRTQDEEVGDGTTGVIVLAGEILSQSLPYLERSIHPILLIRSFKSALQSALQTIDLVSQPIDTQNESEMLALIKSTLGTKFTSRWSELMCGLALKAVKMVWMEEGDGGGKLGSARKEVDIKRYVRVERIPGGEIEDCRVVDGVMINKDVTHPAMRRRIANPRVILLDCTLEYKKGESQTDIEIVNNEGWDRALSVEEEQLDEMCKRILEFKPDLVITEKGVADYAQAKLLDANVSCLRRVRKSDNNRIARVVGATIVNRVEDLRENDVGKECGMFHIEKVADDYFAFLDECSHPQACTVLLRGPSKDILSEIDRNLADAMAVARNVVFDPRICPGGGATEMAISVALAQKAKSISSGGGLQSSGYKIISEAMEVIPRTLVGNCGGNAVRVLTEMRAKHAQGLHNIGVEGLDTGKVMDMKEYGLMECAAVKVQAIKTAVECACLLLRVDDIVSAKRPKDPSGGGAPGPQMAGGGGMDGEGGMEGPE